MTDNTIGFCNDNPSAPNVGIFFSGDMSDGVPRVNCIEAFITNDLPTISALGLL